MKNRYYLLVVLVFAACSNPREDIVAAVNQSRITTDNYTSRYAEFLTLTHLPDNLLYRFNFANSMIDEIVLLKYAKEHHFYDQPDNRRALTEIHDQLLLNALYEAEIADENQPTDDELRRMYQWSKSSIHVQHLFARSLEEITGYQNRLNSGTPWDSLAKSCFKDSELRQNGGDLGFVHLGDLDPAFEETAFSMADGEISDPVQTEYGYSIIRVIERETDPFLMESEFQLGKKRFTRIAKSYKKKPMVRHYTDQVGHQLNIKFYEAGLNALKSNWENSSHDHMEIAFQDGTKNCLTIGRTDENITVEQCFQLLNTLSSNQTKYLDEIEDYQRALSGLLIREELLKKARALNLDSEKNFTDELALQQNNYMIKEVVNSIRQYFPQDDIVQQRQGYLAFRDSLKLLENIRIDSIALKSLTMEKHS